jgi:putative zinc finger/helix-turn-helix YgiT family protein
MRCVECGNPEMRPGEARHEFFVAGVRIVGNMPALVCPDCGATTVEASALEALELSAADAMAKNGMRTGEVFRFMRKALGLRAIDIGQLLGFDPATLSRWERGHTEPDPLAFLALSALVADRIENRTTTRDILEALAHPPKRKVTEIELPKAS